ncbi:hypothetical protein ACFOET_11490 [Parapedobacter deserti]|uniref:Integral membrane protein n=1 Tax=Parapedobacter deserti TaxID=1912957 RepID=A0ABV7JMX1_9SPHI
MIALLNVIIQATCLVAACRYLWHDPEWHWAAMPWYLALVTATEAFGGYLGSVLGINSVPLYNLFLLIEGTFISYFCYRLCRPYGMRFIHWCCWMLVFTGTYTAELTIAGSFSSYATATIILVSLSFVAGCLYYGAELFRLGDVRTSLHRHGPSMWIIAIAYFYSGTLIASLPANALITLQIGIAGIPVYSLVFLLLNYILYTLWIYTFLCRYRNRTSQRQ